MLAKFWHRWREVLSCRRILAQGRRSGPEREHTGDGSRTPLVSNAGPCNPAHNETMPQLHPHDVSRAKPTLR